MILITYQNNVYIRATINLSVRAWKAQPGFIMHESVVIAIDDDHPLANKILEFDNFKPIIENGELVDVKELPPVEYAIPISEQIAVYERNLIATDGKVLRELEAMLPQLRELTGITISTRCQELVDERREWRKAITELQQSEKVVL